MVGRIKNFALALVLLFLGGCVFSMQDSRLFEIAAGGRPSADIIVSDTAPPPVRHAAEELKSILETVTDARFKLTATPTRERNHILVGPGAVASMGMPFDSKGLGSDGIIIHRDGRNLVLAGGSPRGTLYAVYEFLQRDVGCRWWSSSVSLIPVSPLLSVEVADTRYVPPFEYRYPYWKDAFDPDWAVRNKSNGPDALSAPQYGGNMTHGGVHTFFKLIPPGKYFSTHPDWFSMIDGKRIHERAQLCLSNDEMRAQLVANLKKRMADMPFQNVFSVSPNDWRNYCTCPECKKTDDAEGGPAGTLLLFVNKVAEEVERDFPNRSVSTLAYQYSRKPPKIVKPRSNVIIQLCSIECSFAVSLDSPRNVKFRDDIVGWSQIADRLYIWDYTTDFRHHFMPHPNLFVLGSNIKFFAAHNVKGVFEQGAYTTSGAEFSELRAWVLARLLWNPALDDRALIAEFCHGYYGAAGGHILNYIELIHQAAADGNEPAKCLPSYKHFFPYLTFQILSDSWGIMSRAEEAVNGDAEVLNRVKMAKLPVMYAFMWNWNALREQAKTLGAEWPLPGDIKQVAAEFKKIAKANGVTRVNEWNEGFDLVDQAVKRADFDPSQNSQ